MNKEKSLTESSVTSYEGIPDTVCIDLYYPRSNEVKFIEVNLMDVRGSDGIRISYDFDRGGWIIEQPTDTFDKNNREIWKESAFLEAWAKDEEMKRKLDR